MWVGGERQFPPYPPHALLPNAVGTNISTLLLKTIINIKYEENKDYIIFKKGLVFGG